MAQRGMRTASPPPTFIFALGHNYLSQPGDLILPLLVEMKLNDVMMKVEKLGGDVGEANGEHEAQTKAQLM